MVDDDGDAVRIEDGLWDVGLKSSRRGPFEVHAAYVGVLVEFEDDVVELTGGEGDGGGLGGYRISQSGAGRC